MHYNKKTLIGIGCLALAFILVVISYMQNHTQSKPTTSTSTTNSTTTSQTAARLKLNDSITKNGVTVTPLEVTEDSRCPADVTCLWGGTVIVRVHLLRGNVESTQTLELNKAIVFEHYLVTITNVTPLQNSKVSIAPADYRFDIDIEPEATARPQ